MEMIEPAPRRSKYAAGAVVDQIDYDMTSPLDKERPYPCRGHEEGPSVATYTPGDSIRVKLGGSASHNGGHCQFSLSIDGGKTFIVTKTVIGDCMIADLEYEVPIPNSIPTGKAVLGWTWINKTGNREYYMNCADIDIRGGTGQCISGPTNFIANLPGFPLIPEFPNDNGFVDYFKNRPFVTSCSTEKNSHPSMNKDDFNVEVNYTHELEHAISEYPEAEELENRLNHVNQPTNPCKIQCIDGPTYQVCGHGGMTPFRMKCAAGTTCRIQSGQVFCL